MNTLTLQRHLHRLGFDPGALDGIDGPKTQAALRSFMAAHGCFDDDPESAIFEASQRIVDGLDTSYFQSTQDWSKLDQPLERNDIFAPFGFQFSIVRASYFTSNDSTFVDKAHASLDAGVTTFAYHFIKPLDPPGPQIDVLAEQCRRAGLRSKTVALDLEWTPPGMKGAALVEWFVAKATTILDNLRAAVAMCTSTFGKKPIVYFYPAYWQQLGHGALSAEWTSCPLWLSAPTNAGGIHKPVAPWPSCAFHQWTDDANVVVPVDGYGGPHILADRFNGTLDELRDLT